LYGIIPHKPAKCKVHFAGLYGIIILQSTMHKNIKKCLRDT